MPGSSIQPPSSPTSSSKHPAMLSQSNGEFFAVDDALLTFLSYDFSPCSTRPTTRDTCPVRDVNLIICEQNSSPTSARLHRPNLLSSRVSIASTGTSTIAAHPLDTLWLPRESQCQPGSWSSRNRQVRWHRTILQVVCLVSRPPPSCFIQPCSRSPLLSTLRLSQRQCPIAVKTILFISFQKLRPLLQV
jgi:hypothetical protein